MHLLLALFASARAETKCASMDEFNAWMGSHDGSTTVVLTFDATGVNPNDFFGTKGALADLADLGCAEGASLALKVYGPDDPPNEAHPAGTLKQEYGDACCGEAECGEDWADPNPSAVVFVDGTETCDVTIWIDPDTFGYELACNTGTFTAVGENGYDIAVNRISMFELADGSTWEIDNAISTWNQVCWEVEDAPDTGDTGDTGETGGTEEFAAEADVTVSSSYPDSVYPDESDLSVEAGDSEVFLRFDARDVPGRIVSAALELRSLPDSWAEGTGATAWAVEDNGWSEDTLTWNARPTVVGAALDRVSPVEADEVYGWDVSAAVSAPAVYSFALVPEEGDTNGSHFRSKEAGQGPVLRLTWVPADDTGDSGETGDSGDGGDDSGVDDAEGDSGDPFAEAPPAPKGGCGCGATGGTGAWAALAVLLTAARRGAPRSARRCR